MLDLVGTTVMEKDPTMINRCFELAFADHGLAVSADFIVKNRGRSKRKVIAEALAEKGIPAGLAADIEQSLQRHLLLRLNNFYANEGVEQTIRWLKSRQLLVGIGSGLQKDIFLAILESVQLPVTLFDYAAVAEDFPNSRPHPDMLIDFLHRHSLSGPELLKVGDTVADIEEGRQANAKTAAILSGTQPEVVIAAARPDFLVRSFSELKQIISRHSH
jgi:HAD superfamily hydrolase (TIGR01549 family)